MEKLNDRLGSCYLCGSNPSQIYLYSIHEYLRDKYNLI